jgi:predicted N-acetyltransferase YhbS
MFTVVSEQPCHGPEIVSLLDHAFGPGRFTRTAYLMRQGTAPEPGLSFVAIEGDRVVGSIQSSPIHVGLHALYLLGPLVVDPKQQGNGVGLALMLQSLEVAKKTPAKGTLLIGDAPYYERAGFVPMPAGRIELPGPWDPARLLGLAHSDFDLADLYGKTRPGWPV